MLFQIRDSLIVVCLSYWVWNCTKLLMFQRLTHEVCLHCKIFCTFSSFCISVSTSVDRDWIFFQSCTMKSFVEIGSVTNSWKMNRKLSCVEALKACMLTLFILFTVLWIIIFFQNYSYVLRKYLVLPFTDRVLLIVILLISSYTFVSLPDHMILKMVTSLCLF